MPVLKRRKSIIALLFVALAYLNNTSLLAHSKPSRPLLFAHRGLGQTFHTEGLTGKTNTATRIFPPEHPYLENTLASMQAAFDYGADIVEFDIHATADSQLAVFHDATLEYRTNESGLPEEHTLAQLQALDIGYGYTADSGKTYPFRGKGIGLMPSLEQVLNRFPSGSFLIHIKDNSTQVGKLLAKKLKLLTQERLKHISVFGSAVPIEVVKNELPAVNCLSKESLKKAMMQYEAIGWTGYIPAGMKNTLIFIPEKYTSYIWGWPYRFLNRMERVNTQVILLRDKDENAGGFDNATDLKSLPKNYSGGIWTNRIDKIGPLYGARH